ncbi:MAG: hypothetical protein IKM28_01145 [Lachnospiraceae bacterium]|nr:hypothetical protein [Lachnospiraceae bacterium]
MKGINKDLSDPKKAAESRNLTAMKGSGAMYAVLGLAYSLEVIKGDRSFRYLAIILFFCILPHVLSIICYLRKKDSHAIQYIIGVSFALFYGCIVFTAATRLTFCYIIVVYIILAVYVNKWLSIGIGIYAVLVNIAEGVVLFTSGKAGDNFLMEMEVILACLIFSIVFSLMSYSKITEINQANIQQAQRERKQSEELLATILEVANQLGVDVSRVTVQTERLKGSVGSTQTLMERFSQGTAEVAEVISIQKDHTEEINRQISEVGMVADSMVGNIHGTEESLEAEKQTITCLLKQLEESEKAGKRVSVQMESLMDYAEKMQGILGMIKSVANQTALLSLNAGIEAARAGEAGRGFAVVASEISSLAGQTRSATEEINKLIGNVTAAAREATESVSGLLESNDKQSDYIGKAVENFEQIEKEVGNIFVQIDHLKRMIDTVSMANSAVSENIDSVFLVTQEVADGVNGVLKEGSHDLESIEGIVKIMQGINASTERLRRNKGVQRD